MLFVISILILLPILLIAIGLIGFSFYLTYHFSFLPLRFLSIAKHKYGKEISLKTLSVTKTICKVMVFVLFLLLIYISKPFYYKTASLGCDILGSLDATGRKVKECDQKLEWLNPYREIENG